MSAVRRVNLLMLLLGSVGLVLLTLPGLDRSAASEHPAWRLRLLSGGALTTQTVHEATDSLGWVVSASISPGTGMSRAPAGAYPLAAGGRRGGGVAGIIGA